MIERKLTAPAGGVPPASLADGLSALATVALGYLAAYTAWIETGEEGERANALLWAGALFGLVSQVHALTLAEPEARIEG